MYDSVRSVLNAPNDKKVQRVWFLKGNNSRTTLMMKHLDKVRKGIIYQTKILYVVIWGWNT